MQLRRHGDRVGRPVSVLGHDEVRLAGARRLLVVVVVTVQKDDDVGVLLDRVVRGDAVGDEVVDAGHRRVVDGLLTQGFDRGDLVPEHVVGRVEFQIGALQRGGDTAQARLGRGVRRRSAFLVGEDCLDRVPHRAGDGVGVDVPRAALKRLEQPGTLDRPVAGQADLPQEPQLVVAARDVQRVPDLGADGLDRAQPGTDAEPEQQPIDAVEQASGSSRRSTRDLRRPTLW